MDLKSATSNSLSYNQYEAFMNHIYGILYIILDKERGNGAKVVLGKS